MKFITPTTLVAALILSGCASVEMAPKAESAKAKEFNAPRKGNAGIYIYRNGFLGAALKRDLWIDGNCIGESATDTFFYKEVAGGKSYQLATESEFSPNVLDVTLESDKNHFFRQYIKMGLVVGGAGLEPVSVETGKQDVSKLEMAKSGKCSSKPPSGTAKAIDTNPQPESSTAVTQAVTNSSIAVTPITANSANTSPSATPAMSEAATPVNAASQMDNSMTRTSMPSNQITTVTNVPSASAIPNIQLIEFALGVSSVTVERLAKEQSCTNNKGAGLVSPKGTQELYKMQCSDGRVLMAKCELRQCTIVSHK